MDTIFGKTEMKNLSKNKGAQLRFLVTSDGIQFLPQVDKACCVMAVLRPVKCRYSPEFIGELCSVEDDGFIAKMADVIDFEAISIYDDEGKPFMDVAGKTFPVHYECLVDTPDNTFYTKDSQYENTVRMSVYNAEVVKNVSVCMSDDRNRYCMCGVFLSPEGMAVATDGKRMSYQKLDDTAAALVHQKTCMHLGTEEEGFFIPDYLVPFMGKDNAFSWTMHEETRKIEGQPDEKHLSAHARFLLNADGNNYLYVPVKGQFPNYKKVIPDFYAQEEHKCEIDFAVLKGYKKVGKSATPVLCAKGSKVWQDYDGVEIPFGLSLPLADDEQLTMNLQYVLDMKEAFGKKFEGTMSWKEDAYDNNVDKNIVKPVVFSKGEYDPHVIIMPLKSGW